MADMAESKFSIKEAIGFGWQTLTSKFGALLLYMVLPLILYAIANTIYNRALAPDHEHFNITLPLVLIGIVLTIINMFIWMGILRMTIKLVDSQEISFADFATSPKTFFNYLGAGLLYGLIVTGGMMLLVVPAIIWGVQFSYYGLALLDKNLGGITALKRSSHLTKGVKWKLIGFSLVCVAVQIAGFICLIIGAIPASIITLVAVAHVYRQLCKSQGEAAVPVVA